MNKKPKKVNIQNIIRGTNFITHFNIRIKKIMRLYLKYYCK
jgi:hypothetical protein